MCQKPEVDSLTNDMSKLFVNKLMSDYQGQCTPVADRPNKTWTSKNLITYRATSPIGPGG